MNIRVAPDTAQVRACTPDDMPAVAGLFQRTFRNARRATPASLTAYLRELYFEHPWRRAGPLPRAGLFQRTFRNARRATPASLTAYLRELYFEHPWRDLALVSKVFVADGAVRGFIGILPLRLSFRGRTLRAAVAVSLMVENPQANPLAGARLFRAYLSGPQDASLSDSANPVSRGMWERLGGKNAHIG